MFTKEHYEAIANIIRDLTDSEDKISKDDLVDRLAHYLEKDNDKFNLDKFIKACCAANG